MKQEYYLGLDIGGTKCAVSVGEVRGDTIRVLERKKVPTTKDPLQTLNGSPHIFVNILTCNIFGKETYRVNVNVLGDTAYGHGGGDVGMMEALLDFYNGNSPLNTTIAESMQSHYMGFAAEKSRRESGKLISLIM